LAPAALSGSSDHAPLESWGRRTTVRAEIGWPSLSTVPTGCRRFGGGSPTVRIEIRDSRDVVGFRSGGGRRCSPARRSETSPLGAERHAAALPRHPARSREGAECPRPRGSWPISWSADGFNRSGRFAGADTTTGTGRVEERLSDSIQKRATVAESDEKSLGRGQHGNRDPGRALGSPGARTIRRCWTGMAGSLPAKMIREGRGRTACHVAKGRGPTAIGKSGGRDPGTLRTGVENEG